MGLLTSTWYGDSFLLAGVAVVLTIIYFKRKYQYWKKLGVPVPDSLSIPFGHFKGVNTKKAMGMIVADLYKEVKNEKVIGIYFFARPILVVRDLDVIKDMFVKDFASFHDRGIEVNSEREPLANHLFMMKGQEWRNLRIKLTPTFTSGKMKMMFSTLVDVGKELEKLLIESSKQPEVEIKEILARYSTDVIASCAFGIEANSMQNPETKFRVYGKEMSNPSIRQLITGLMFFMFPKYMKYFPFKLVPEHITDFFVNLVRDTMDYREKNNTQRKDFMQLLIQLKTLGYIKDADNPEKDEENVDTSQKFTVEQAAAQAFLFFFAGFETSSTTMQFALYELALNTELQAKLQAEIEDFKAKNDGQLTYNALHDMDLLDRTVAETLRKYNVVGVLMRECNKEYKVPDTKITVPAGTTVWFPTYAIHHDEKYYPNPSKFDPDRFLPEAKAERNSYAYLPFGEGPRNCIGNRFALMQIKVALAIVLSGFNVSPSKGTPIPIEFSPKSDLLVPKGGLYLKLTKR